MAHQSYAKSVLDKALELAAAHGGEVSAGDVSSALFAQTRQQHKRVLNILSNLALAHRLQRVRQGVYAPLSPAGRQPDKREVMWNVLRMRRRVTVEDLVEMAEVNKDYARQWLRMLASREVIHKVQSPGMAGVWVMMHDTREMPEDTAKAERLQKIRKRHKERLRSRLDDIGNAIGEIRALLDDMDKE